MTLRIRDLLAPLACVLGLTGGFAGLAHAGNNGPPTVVLNELGQGSVTFVGPTTTNPIPLPPGILAADPFGLPAVLFYPNLGLFPYVPVAGDIRILESPGGAVSDLIRFYTGLTGVFFYSDNSDGVDALADTGFPPPSSLLQTNFIDLIEPANGIITYVPLPGQPGFNTVVGASVAVTFQFISDGDAVPEPASLAILGTGLIGVGMARRRRASAAR